MPKQSHRPLTHSYSRAHSSFESVQLRAPRSRRPQRTLSIVSKLSEETSGDADVSLVILTNKPTKSMMIPKPKITVLATVTATKNELIRAGNVAFTRLLNAYNHAKQQYNKIE
jgi:hypothetical protein